MARIPSNIPLGLIQGCANTLLNLAYDHGREIEITKCGAVSVLLITALVASDSDETRHACTKALTNLLCEKQVRTGMPDQHVTQLEMQ